MAVAALGLCAVATMVTAGEVATTPVGISPGSGHAFTDCEASERCPPMVVVPAAPAGFTIGSPEQEPERLSSEARHAVSIKPFAIGRGEVSVGDYMACVGQGGCRPPEWLEPGSEHHIETGRGVTYRSVKPFITGDRQPVVGVSHEDATAYAAWLARKTGKPYRLPSEAEWEHAARSGTTTAYWWGGDARPETGGPMGCCQGCGSTHDGSGFYPVDALPANAWGLHNVHGNVWEWVADYYCQSYASGPSDGSARLDPKCPGEQGPEGVRVLRGGSCFYDPQKMRAAMRLRNWPQFRNFTVGFRVARSLD
ncbi:MAG: SUMF1/EgtB/PvdO family nonheme iron enzyme [Hyphomicrobiaceae bacterium]|nr:SUMF1/EgtB/PvdO family nonheme iron enzyme [Hyphomicrobiaceae bacterium]